MANVRCPYFIMTYRPMMEIARINSIDRFSLPLDILNLWALFKNNFNHITFATCFSNWITFPIL